MLYLRRIGLSLLLVGATSIVAHAQTKQSSTSSAEKARTVHYELKFEELKYVFGPLPPVMRVHAGDIIDTTTSAGCMKGMDYPKWMRMNYSRRPPKSIWTKWSTRTTSLWPRLIRSFCLSHEAISDDWHSG
jgi:hypothetical protein